MPWGLRQPAAARIGAFKPQRARAPAIYGRDHHDCRAPAIYGRDHRAPTTLAPLSFSPFG